jgi:hypothetical protein
LSLTKLPVLTILLNREFVKFQAVKFLGEKWFFKKYFHIPQEALAAEE